MRIWINTSDRSIVTGGETFIPDEWLHLDESWGEPHHPDIVEAWIYVQEKINAAKQETPATTDAEGNFVEDEKYQKDLATKLQEQGIDQMVTALDAANKDYGVKPYAGSIYVAAVLETAAKAEAEASKG
jgi:hypothetical protein